jgi:glycerol uptake facilitator-like aquaporin
MLTGGSLNPARSLGPAIFANVWSHHYIYWVGPLIGATIAGGFYRYQMISILMISSLGFFFVLDSYGA